MVADYTVTGDSFAARNLRVWSGTQLANTGLNPNYDVAPDGKRIAAVMPAEGLEESQAQSRGIFLQNFLDEVRRRAPAGK